MMIQLNKPDWGRCMLCRFWLILACCLLVGQVYGDTMIEAGIFSGGDELIESPYNDGQTGSVKAGGMYSFAFGPMFKVISRWQLQTTIGLKTSADYGDEVDVYFVRYPFNAVLFYAGDSYRIGLGSTYHFSPKLKGSGTAENISQSFENASGTVVEINFRSTSRFLWGFRFTQIEYKNRQGSTVYNGDSIGLLIIAQM